MAVIIAKEPALVSPWLSLRAIAQDERTTVAAVSALLRRCRCAGMVVRRLHGRVHRDDWRAVQAFRSQSQI